MRLSQITILIGLSLSSVNAYKLNFYRGEGCRNEGLGEWIGGPNEGCRNDNAGVAQSVVLASTGEVDDNFMITFFSSNDCNPDTEILHDEPDTEAEAGKKCLTVSNYGSFAVWDVYAEE